MVNKFGPVNGLTREMYSSLWMPAVLLGGLLLLTLIMEFVLTWQAHDRIRPLNAHIAQIVRLQNANINLQKELIDSLNHEGQFTDQERRSLGVELSAIIETQALMSKQTPQVLILAQATLLDTTRQPEEALVETLARLRQAIDLEAKAHENLVGKIEQATKLALWIGSIVLVVVPVGAVLLLFLMRRRILAPLEHLSFLMSLLGRSDYTQAPLTSVDPILRPLTRNYNNLVARLEELEVEHAKREQDLETQVDYATSALLDQQRNLADTERLAVLGEMMARVAHELRNPLAGIKLACTNLHREMCDEKADSRYIERINLVKNEIDRIIAVLNAMLGQSRHNPEPAVEVNIAEAVAELLPLVRYQIPEQIALVKDIPESIVCRLPNAMLRQALLNLILNASQALKGQQGSITIHALVKNASLHLTVEDDGPGFPDELLQAGIRSFSSHHAGGTGLGLSMVQRFVNVQGGDIKIANRVPHGASVSLILPCRNAHD